MFRETIFSKTWINGLFALSWLAVITLAGWLVGRGQFQWILFLALLFPVALVVLLNPKLALVFIILSAFSLEYLAGQGLLPVAAFWTVDGLVLLLFSRVLLMHDSQTGWFMKSPAFMLTALWALLVILSALVNATSPLQIILGIRAYLRFIILYFCLLEFDWDTAFLEKAIRLIVVLFLLQIPVAIMQRMQGLNFDRISGTLKGTGIIGTLAIPVSSGLVSYSLFGNSKWSLALGIAVLLLPAFASARAFLLIIPVFFIYTLLRLHRKLITWQAILLVAGLLLILINWNTLQGRDIYGKSSIEILNNPRIFLKELWMGPLQSTQGATIGRLAGIQLTWERASETLPSLLFGYGPASAQGSRFGSLSSSLYDDLALSGSKASQFTRSLLEWGILGTLAYTFLLLYLWWQSEKAYRRFTDPFWKAAAFGHMILAIVMILLSSYTATWSSTPTAFMFWFVGGAVHRYANEIAGAPELIAEPDAG